MGWDFSEFFSDAGAKAEAALKDAVQLAKPAVEVAAAEWAESLIKDFKQEKQGELNTVIKQSQSNPAQPGSVAHALQTTVQGTFLELYGMHIIIGIVVLIALGFVLRGK